MVQPEPVRVATMSAGDLIVFVIFVAVLLAIAWIPASMARKKGYSFGVFYIFGFLMFLPAVVTAAMLRDKVRRAPEQALVD